jgi:hypothetical protein
MFRHFQAVHRTLSFDLLIYFDENPLSWYVYGLVVGCLNDTVYFLETDSAFLGGKMHFWL